MLTAISDINQVLIQEDIEGLIEAGAPDDEYRDEAIQLAAALVQLKNEEKTVESIFSLLFLIWVEAFELGEPEMRVRQDALLRVSHAILNY